MFLDQLCLHLFGDGGDGGAGAASGDGAVGQEAQDSTGVPVPDAGERKGRKRREDPYANVKFGRDPGAEAQPEPQPQQAAQPERKSFEELINGEYKEDYGRAMQNVVNRRFPVNKANEDRLNKLAPMLEMLAQLHGLERGEDGSYNEDEIIQAVLDDDALYEEEAAKRGMSVESTRHVMQLERDAAARKAADEARAAQERSYANYQRVVAQADAARQIYPGLDLNKEMDNRDFARLIGVGVPVQTAFEVVHKDEILRGSMQYAAQAGAQKVANSVAANARRPSENGTGSRPSQGTIWKNDPSKLTREERKELRKRVARGEKIVW